MIAHDGRVTVGGLDVAYREDGRGDGPLALCLHGFPDGAGTWRHLLPRLAAAGWHAVAPWLRGYPPTSVPPDPWTTPEVLGADASALHAALDADGRAVVIGHDWGAVAARAAVSAAPDRWAAVVTLSLPPLRAVVPARRDPRQWRRSWYTALFQLPGAERLVAARDLALVEHLWRAWSPGWDPTGEHLDEVKASLGEDGALTAALGYYRGTARALLGRLPPVPEAPQLHLHGADDGCLHVRYAERARSQLDGLRSGVEVVPDSGHFPQLERPEHVAARILRFLDEVTAG